MNFGIIHRRRVFILVSLFQKILAVNFFCLNSLLQKIIMIFNNAWGDCCGTNAQTDAEFRFFLHTRREREREEFSRTPILFEYCLGEERKETKRTFARMDVLG